jgi:hypothetical protein
MMIGLFLSAMVACSSGGGPASTQPTLRASESDDITMQMSIRDEFSQDILYRVEKDGSISFGGGIKALIDKTTWTGQMTDDERRQLHDLILQHGWFERDPVSTNDPKTRVYRIDLRGPEGHNSFKVVGQNADVQPIADLLAKICLRRLEPDLQKLPEPGPQRR